MSENMRMIALLGSFLGVIFILFNVFSSVMSEELDEKAIRILYNTGDTLMKTPQEYKKFLEKRLDDNYLQQATLTYVMKEKPEQTTPLSLNKSQAIDMAMQGISAMEMAKREHKVIDIKFTEDKQYAYASSTETSSGKITFPMPEGKKIIVPYNAASSCVDTLMLVNATIHFVRSSCKSKIALIQ